jgi:iron complex transport system substrate-binding protein
MVGVWSTSMRQLLFLLLCLHVVQARATITVHDDAGSKVVLQQPAKRVISLAPHVTELIFAAGGGERIVGTVSYSDYPPAAKDIPRVGDHKRIDIERLIALKPDLLVVWLHGGSERQLEPLRRLGIPFYYSEPQTLADIPEALLTIGKLLGTEDIAQKRSAELRQRLAGLAAKYGAQPKVRVFYQVWDQPLYTLNGSSIVSDAIRLCGGENIFGHLPLKAPTVSIESVLLENPEVIISGDRRNKTASGLERWKQYPTFSAAQRDNLFLVDADLMNRAGPRAVDGAEQMCHILEQARQRRKEQP